MAKNEAEIKKWTDISENNPALKDAADKRLEELKQGDQFLRQTIKDRTKVIEPDSFLNRLAKELADEHQQEQQDLATLLRPLDDKKELDKHRDKDKFGSLDELLGMDGKTEKEREHPLVNDEPVARDNFFDVLLGNPVPGREDADIGRESDETNRAELDNALDSLQTVPNDPTEPLSGNVDREMDIEIDDHLDHISNFLGGAASDFHMPIPQSDDGSKNGDNDFENQIWAEYWDWSDDEPYEPSEPGDRDDDGSTLFQQGIV